MTGWNLIAILLLLPLLYIGHKHFARIYPVWVEVLAWLQSCEKEPYFNACWCPWNSVPTNTMKNILWVWYQLILISWQQAVASAQYNCYWIPCEPDNLSKQKQKISTTSVHSSLQNPFKFHSEHHAKTDAKDRSNKEVDALLNAWCSLKNHGHYYECMIIIRRLCHIMWSKIMT